MRLSELLQSVAERSALATISQARVASEPLRRHLRELLVRPPGLPGSFLGDPVIEAGFEWHRASQTMHELAGDLLDPDLVDALDGKIGNGGEGDRHHRYRFAREWAPYQHQLEAWKVLAGEPRSVLVTSGTGSGKTECFLIPILDSLVRQKQRGTRLTGVQAIMIYPLNALINSQRDRLNDWMSPFGGALRYCLYNGETPDEVRSDKQRQQPWRVLSRKKLRADPPPILVTNVTMLEYMLVRKEDASILERSHGCLRWIVLDEAHSYVGSQAAEISLLIRRVLRAFGVEAQQVRFVATSATIGEGEGVRTKLQQFLADVAGVTVDRVSVIEGRRDVIPLPDEGDEPLPPPESIDPVAAGMSLARSARFRALRRKLSNSPMTLTEVTENLFGSDARADPVARASAVDIVDLASQTRFDGRRLLPLRLHLFHRGQPGLWACVDPACSGRPRTALDCAEWAFGQVLIEQAERCPACGSPTFEIAACTECSTPVLLAEETDMGILQSRRHLSDEDEFSQDVDAPEPDPDSEEEASIADAATGHPCVLAATLSGEAEHVWVERRSGRILDMTGISGETVPVHLLRKEKCPGCGAVPTTGRPEVFRRTRFGAPFLLGNVIPQLLEAAPPRPEPGLPANGRQLITFTDSRQGTARFAARLQQDSERNYVRSALYHMVQHDEPAAADDERRLREEIASLEPIAKVNRTIANILEEKLQELERVLRPPEKEVGWLDAVRQLADSPEIAEWMGEVWEDRDSRYAERNTLAEMLLLREFVRRPRNQNSAETMGLVALRWPAIDRLTSANLPSPFAEAGLTTDDWRDFLYILVTYQLRANTALDIDRDTLRWIGVPGRSRAFAGPGRQDDRTRYVLPWPKASRTGRSRPVHLLARALDVDPASPDGADRIDACLETAWAQLQPLGISDANGFRVSLRKAQLAAVQQAWICPVTGRVLDRIFAGMTPYQPIGDRCRRLPPERIRMPQFLHAWGRHRDAAEFERSVREWLAEDVLVQEARARGAWTNLHDRIALFAPYFRVAEHSAQQSSTLLQRYEKRFKQGLVNILSCSTTMEMGVDIGGISTVVMTNVPPAPANYRQRVGRAGRRDEGRAIALTFCPDNPLGWSVFRQPKKWAFEQSIRPPSVSLDSPIIVQRHVNALLLSRFLRDEAGANGENALTLCTGWFFGSRAQDRAQSPASRFVAWCASVSGLPEDVEADVAAVVASSCLEGRLDLGTETAARLEATMQEWLRERDGIEKAAAMLSPQDGAAQKALELQRKRLDGEYLLKELSTRGFLPGYGFPTDVVPIVIDPPTAGLTDFRDDNRFQVREYPSRQLELAIRDYAPGSEIVLDGLVYRSAGVTLNWQRPAGAPDVREIQALRYAWRCQTCGMTDTCFGLPELCSVCGSDEIEKRPYLRPAGFATDIREKPHTDISRVSFVPPAKPWISARRGVWTSLADADLGRFRTTRDGHVFHHTGGSSGHGFALCLECGRAGEEDVKEGTASPLPSSLRDHRPLRGARRGADGICAGVGSPFAIRRHLRLGHDIHTDVFELQLFSLKDDRVALSLVIALREALARQLGIEPQEMGWSTVRSTDPGGNVCQSVMLYDRAAGGAGFVGQAVEDLPGMFQLAAEILDCRNPNCTTGCPACILNSDSQYRPDQLDRQAALKFARAEVLTRLALPEERRYLGSDSRAEVRPLTEAIDRILQASGGGSLTVWLDAPPIQWDLTAWNARPLLEKWGARHCKPRIALMGATLSLLTPEQRYELARVVERCRGELVTVEELPRCGNGWRVADVHPPRGPARCWIADERTVLVPDENWGSPSGAPLVTGRALPMPAVIPEDPRRFAEDLLQFVLPIEITRELDGPIEGFGRRFWERLFRARPDAGQLVHAGEPIATVMYEDRYVRSPLMVRLLAEVLRPLSSMGGGSAIRLVVRTAPPEEREGTPALLRHDWRDQTARDFVLETLLRNLGFSASLDVQSRNQLPHRRTLNIEWSNGSKLSIGLDQGLGYWTPLRPVPFPFTAAMEDQAATLSGIAVDVSGTKGSSTVIYLPSLARVAES